VPRSFEIGVANVIERLRAGVACASGFPWRSPHYRGQRSQPFELWLPSACFQAWMSGFFVRPRYRKGIKDH
jgi:hypothetical protein